jgi:Na+/H+ antiporter NhaD/arsenite permease-like protein
MLLGRIPRLQLDRTGIALLGALILVITRELTLEDAAAALDLPTLALLFGLMVLSAQLRLGGFYQTIALKLANSPLSPTRLLAVLIFAVGALAAVFTNDVICLAISPVVIDACLRRRVNPVPFLLALACAANVGSAATLIGNPQNMLIGQVLHLSFAHYLAQAILPAILGLAATWAVIALQFRAHPEIPAEVPVQSQHAPPPPVRFDRWQAAKGLLIAAGLLVAFLFTDWPRELVALAAAGIVLTSRKMHSREMLGLVDWQLLVLFAGLFIVNGALQRTGVTAETIDSLRQAGLDIEQPGTLFGATVMLGNIVSNVPAVMLLLPAATHPIAGLTLALASTLAGNLVIVGSIANIIVVDIAARHGVHIDWRTHLKTGLPVTIITLVIAGLTIGFIAWLQ